MYPAFQIENYLVISTVRALLCSWFIVVIYGQSNGPCPDQFYRVTDPSKTLDVVVSTLHNIRGLVECAGKCTETEKCVGFEYDYTTLTCTLGYGEKPGSSSSPSIQLLYMADTTIMDCASNGFDYTECPTSSPVRRVTLMEQKTSRPNCTLNTTYGISAAGVLWTDGGCRGSFLVYF